MKKDIKFVWGEEQQKMFKRVKIVILETILLMYPSPNCPFEFYPDASSKYAMGSVLEQDGKIVSTLSWKFKVTG